MQFNQETQDLKQETLDLIEGTSYLVVDGRGQKLRLQVPHPDLPSNVSRHGKVAPRPQEVDLPDSWNQSFESLDID